MTEQVSRPPLTIRIVCGGWVVQDGVYPEVSVGDDFLAAFEFAPVGQLRRADHSGSPELEAIHHPQADYAVTAEVTWSSPDLVMLDAGLVTMHARTFSLKSHGQFVLGEYVTGEIQLGLSPWIGDDFLRDIPEALKPVHECHLDRIVRVGHGIVPELDLRALSTDRVSGIDTLLLDLTVR